MKFDGQLIAEEVTARTWQLTRALGWSASDGFHASVPVGYDTDFASVPRILWPILPPTGSYTKAAVLHDWLYWEGLTTRAEADAYFLEAMRDCGTALWQRVLIYMGVRIGGWWTWNNYRRERAGHGV